jgi:hypothetical protein
LYRIGEKQGRLRETDIEYFLSYVESLFEKIHEIGGVVLGKRNCTSINGRGQETVTDLKIGTVEVIVGGGGGMKEIKECEHG